MTIITKQWLAEHEACAEGVAWWEKHKKGEPLKVLNALIADDKLDWANWFIVRVMSYKQYVSYAVYAAEQVIGIYEREYPNDKRPRNAIEAAKKCIDNPSEENKSMAESAASAARSAARSAAWRAESAASAARSAAWRAESAWSAGSAARSAAWSAARSASWSAASEAWSAARSAAWSASWRAGSAARSAAWSASWRAAGAVQKKILNYGIELLEGGDDE